MKPTPQVTVKQFINGKRERVFQAWLKPELVVQWFSPENLTPLSFKTDAKVGGAYVHVMSGPDGVPLTTIGKYLEIVENQRLVFTWTKEGRDLADSVVTVDLEDQDGGTLVTLTHSKLPEDLINGHVKGWESALRHLEHFFKGNRS